VDNAAKNRSAAGAGPSARGVQADKAVVVTSTATAKLEADTADTADAKVVFVAIEADVMELRDATGGGAPRLNCYESWFASRSTLGTRSASSGSSNVNLGAGAQRPVTR
jgi:hypothetical protein